MTSTTLTTNQGSWDAAAIRRAMRVLCAQPPNVNDDKSLARGLRIVWDTLQRRGLHPEVFQVPGVMPLLVVGNGPILICTYLDNPNPANDRHGGTVPSISGDTAHGAGVTRIAGLLGALGPIANGALRASDITLVVEADRHLGSLALQSWLGSFEHAFSYAIWETADLPIPAPALFRSSTGTVALSVSVGSNAGGIESFYAGVLPDIGHRLVDALASLKSRDSEVLVAGFYDGVEAPDGDALALLQSLSGGVQTWVLGAADESAVERQLSPAHLTLGVFCAPSVLVRSISLPDSRPYLPQKASAVVEARIMPGQDAHTIVRAISEHISRVIPEAQFEPVLLRRPYNGTRQRLPNIAELARVYPIAPGDSPAGAIGTLGIPSLGFATVSRSPHRLEERIELSSIARAGEFVHALCQRVAEQFGDVP